MRALRLADYHQLREAEAEAQRLHDTAMRRTEEHAQHVYERDLKNLRDELNTKQSFGSSAGAVHHVPCNAPCAECPRKQSKIQDLESKLSSTVAELHESRVHNKRLDDNVASLTTEVNGLKASLGNAKQAVHDLTVQKDAEMQQSQARAREAQQRHAAREAELTGHADNLSNELEKVKAQAAAMHDSASHAGDAKLRQVQDELLIAKTNLANERASREQLDRHLAAVIAQLGNSPSPAYASPQSSWCSKYSQPSVRWTPLTCITHVRWTPAPFHWRRRRRPRPARRRRRRLVAR